MTRGNDHAIQSINQTLSSPPEFHRLPQETTMDPRHLMASAGLALSLTRLVLAAAQAQGAAALTGQVTAAEEGPMEGVLVSARKDGGNITVTVVSDQKGAYSFPAGRLDPGHYTIAI